MEMIVRRARLLAFGAALALAGCSNTTSSDEPGLTRQLFEAAKSFTRRTADTDQGVTLTDAQLVAAPVNVLLLNIPQIGSDVGLVPKAVNRDVITWVTPDGYTVATKAGQVVGTAGFSSDLASADVPDIRGGGPGVVRDHYRLLGDEDIHLIRYFCRLSRRPEQVVVTGRTFATTRVDEACQTEDGTSVNNVYWIDGRGVVRKSRQYISPLLGYFELQDVHGGLR